MHIQFCLEEIICEIDALDATRLPDAERAALCGHVSSMRMLLADCAARTAALALAMPAANVSTAGETRADSAATVAPLASIDVLPPPVAPVPAPIRIIGKAQPVALAAAFAPVPAPIRLVSKAEAVALAAAVEPAPVQPSATIIAQPVAKRRNSLVPLTRIAASILIVIGVGTGAGLQQLQAHAPLVDHVRATLTQSLADSHATLLDVLEAGRRLISRVPDLGGQKAEG